MQTDKENKPTRPKASSNNPGQQLSNAHSELGFANINKIKEQRKLLDLKNQSIKSKIDLLQKEDKKIIDKIFFIKNLQTKVVNARENIKAVKSQKAIRAKKEQDQVKRLRDRNFEFKKEHQKNIQTVLEVHKAKKEAYYKEGKKFKEKAFRIKQRTERRVKTKAKTTKEVKNIGKLWMELKQDQVARERAEKLEAQRKAELAKLKKAKRAHKRFLGKEQQIFANFQKDQEFQETVLDEFKNTINND